MRIVVIISLLFLWACGPKAKPTPQPILESDPVEDYLDNINQQDPYQRWLMNEYDLWQYLKENPSETDVISTIGEPDSVFTDYDRTYKVLYYYIPKLNDYNSIEIDISTGQVTGFEWD